MEKMPNFCKKAGIFARYVSIYMFYGQYGEESGVVSREHYKQIVGLTDNGNRSTLSIY